MTDETSLAEIKAKNIIDEQDPKLVAHLKALLPEAVRVHIAVGYFFISGFAEIMDSFEKIEAAGKKSDCKIRLMISPTTNRRTADVLLAANESVKAVRNQLENPEMSDEEAVERVRTEIRDALGHMPQTAKDREAAQKLFDLIEAEKLEVKVYTKTKLHAKAYIIEYEGNVTPATSIVGSSNLSVAGIKDHLELSIKTSEGNNEKLLLEWFERHWETCEDFTEEIAKIIDESWINAEKYSPRHAYEKAIGQPAIVPISGEDGASCSVPLFEFQQDGFKQALRKIENYGGVIVADVVGTGKSFIGGSLLCHLCSDGSRPLIICPPHLVEMWAEYAHRFGVRNAAVVSRFALGPDKDGEPQMDRYDDCSTILIDESHNFRNTGTKSYQGLSTFMESRCGRTCVIMLTATPISNTVHDIKNQLALFPKESIAALPELGGGTLDDYFKGVQDQKTKRLEPGGREKVREILRHLMIRRTRPMIKDRYATKGKDGRYYLELGGERKYIPEQKTENPREYDPDGIFKDSIYKKKGGEGELFDRLVRDIGGLNLARYAPGRYLKEEYLESDSSANRHYLELERLTASLLGIVRTSLLKRMESSIAAFDSTVRHYKTGSELFLEALDNNTVPIGAEYSIDIYKYMMIEDDNDDDKTDDLKKIKELIGKPSRYDIGAFDVERWKNDLRADIKKLEKIREDTVDEEYFTTYDNKLRVLERIIEENIKEGGHKVLVFTESAVTARYLYRHLRDDYLKKKHPKLAKRIASIDSSFQGSEKGRIVRAFDPWNNPPPKGKGPNEDKYDILISTDVLSEGVNLQSAKKVVNYDFHWNPVRLLQRIGRVNRLGSKFREVHIINFLPTSQLDGNLGLREKVRNKITTIREVVGLGKDAVLEQGEDEPDCDGAADCYDDTFGSDLEGGQFFENITKLTKADEDAERLERDGAELARVRKLPDGLRAIAGTGRLLIYFEAQEERFEDDVGIEEKSLGKKSFRRFYSVSEDGGRFKANSIRETTLRDEMEANSGNPGLEWTDEIRGRYDELVCVAWEEFERDMDRMEAKRSDSKWQKHFQKQLDKIDEKGPHIERLRKFLSARMFTDREPHRSLATLQRRVDRGDVKMLVELLGIERAHGGKVHRRAVGKPRIVCSMMVDDGSTDKSGRVGT